MSERTERDDGYTVVGVIEDGARLNQAVREIRDLGVHPNDLTVILKRKVQDEPEPFPEGTRYIIIPNDRRGLEVPIGFGIAFLVIGLFFVISTPSIGVPTFVVFASLAAVLFAGSFSRVGVEPILTDMEAPREEASSWNEQFELGKVLILASTRDRGILRPLREVLQKNRATYYLVSGILKPRAIHQATLYRARRKDASSETQEAQEV